MKSIKVLIALAIVGVATKMACGADRPTVRMISLINYRHVPFAEPVGPKPLMLPSNGDFALFGLVFRKAYPQEEKASKLICGGVVEKFTPTYPISEEFHGFKTISCELTPSTKRLYSLRLERSNFTGRDELLKEGLAVLGDLGNRLGCKLAPFKYVDLENVNRSLPDPFAPDERLWTTSRYVLAVSHTRIGNVSLRVKLKVDRDGWHKLTILANDDTVSAEGRREFKLEVRRRKDPFAGEEYEEEFPRIEVEFPE